MILSSLRQLRLAPVLLLATFSVAVSVVVACGGLEEQAANDDQELRQHGGASYGYGYDGYGYDGYGYDGYGYDGYDGYGD